MRVRPYTEADLETLKAMHARQGFDYEFPDLNNPTFISKLVLEVGDPDNPGMKLDENAEPGQDDTDSAGTKLANHEPSIRSHDSRLANGAGNCAPRVVMASLARLTCEIYLLADPDAGTPRERYTRLLALHAAAERDLYARGLDDVHAWLPPRIAARFGRRLEALGWVRDDAWIPYSKRLG
jgi:hypothetical protein